MPKHNRQPRAIPPNAPHYTLGAGVLLVVVGVLAAYLTDNRQSMTTLLGLIATTVPSLLAAGYAERASRDIRNGTVTEKAKQGTKQAMDEVGVTEVVEASQRGASSVMATQALAVLLQNWEDERQRQRGAAPPPPPSPDEGRQP